MDNNMEVIVDYLIRVSEGKLQLVKNLLGLTHEQKTVLQSVEDDDINNLNKLIEEKQALINKIDVLDKEFLDKFKTLKESLGLDSFAEITDEPVTGMKDLKEKIQEITEVTEAISKLDQENAIKAKANLDHIKQQLKLVKIGKKTNHGYSKKFNENVSILIDKKK